jgi:DNA invertase Pin-like site-specific DNA recombinase
VKQFDRPGLTALLDHARPGDSLAITRLDRLDRLGRSLKELLETVENLKTKNIGLISLEGVVCGRVWNPTLRAKRPLVISAAKVGSEPTPEV